MESVQNMTPQYDILIVGAGLSGVGAACWLAEKSPSRSFAILEARDAIGGTWDLFRYPGVRSDSDMYTLGYSFRPWRDAKAIADGPAILDYIRETARAHRIEDRIQFRQRVERADWDSAAGFWTVQVRNTGDDTIRAVTCRFMMMCSGYYRYDRGYAPTFQGEGEFGGRIIHPQHWPEELDYSGKRVVVIGSGATAITLVPAMAGTAAHVTMLQRSPTWLFSRPARDAVASFLRRVLPERTAHALARWKNILPGMYFYGLTRRNPKAARTLLLNAVRKQAPASANIERDFTPTYNPWDQRICLAPDGDFFTALHSDKADIVTGAIRTFTANGIELESGQHIAADIVVTATGLELLFAGGVEFHVDGDRIDPAARKVFKGMMLEGAPNLFSVFGYTNASWTLKADLTCEFVCRLLNRMEKRGETVVTAVDRDGGVETEPLLDFSSGYVQRAVDRFPKQGARKPWKLHQNYVLDMLALRHGRIDDPALEFRQDRQAS
jgi:monooxygenase